MGSQCTFITLLSIRLRGRLHKCWLILLFFVFVVMVAIMTIPCSTDKATKQLQELCELYNRGEVAGNLCYKLCQQTTFQDGRCAGVSWGKNVHIMRCINCESENVVLKNAQDMQDWKKYNGLVLNTDQAPQTMVNLTAEYLIETLRHNFEIDLSGHKDVLSFIWRQNMSEFVKKGRCVIEQDCEKRNTVAALQSILSLTAQHDYVSMLLLKRAPYMPKLTQGSCGPAYMVEYTPSLILSGYVLYQGKPDEMFRWPNVIPWKERARVALELIDALRHLESRDPPVIMCDIEAHNFAVDSRGHLRILDAEPLRYDHMLLNVRSCSSNSDCGYNTCKGMCNLTSNTCAKHPVNNMFQVACRDVLHSYIPGFGLLRGPPAPIADQLQQVLEECSFPASSPARFYHQDSWKTNDTLRQTMVSLLKKSLFL